AIHEALGDPKGQVECYCLLAEIAIEHGRLQEAQGLIERARSFPETEVNQSLVVRGLRTAVRAAEVQEDHARARGLGQDLLALCHAIGDRDGAAYAHLRLANNANWTWQVQAALEHSAAAAALYDELGDRLGQASTLVCI